MFTKLIQAYIPVGTTDTFDHFHAILVPLDLAVFHLIGVHPHTRRIRVQASTNLLQKIICLFPSSSIKERLPSYASSIIGPYSANTDLTLQ